MRAALYARVSTAGQAAEDRNSLAAQQAAYASLCAAEGHDPVVTYTDVESGRRSSRSEYQRMLGDARAGAFDLLVVTFLDRFGRDQWEVMARLGELRTLGVEVVATEEPVQEFIFAALAAYKAGRGVEAPLAADHAGDAQRRPTRRPRSPTPPTATGASMGRTSSNPSRLRSCTMSSAGTSRTTWGR